MIPEPSAQSSGAVRVADTPGSQPSTTERQAAADLRHGLLYASGPLLWAALILFHPMPTADSPFDGINEVVDRWLLVHVGQLVLTPLLFLAVWRLLDGLSSTTPTISRGALVVWTVFFSAYDTVQGIATGLLVRHADGLPDPQQSGVKDAVDYLVVDSGLAGNTSFVGMVAGAAWLTVAIAAALALHRANAGRSVVVLTALSTIVAMHMAPAAIGLIALSAAVVLRERQRAESRPARN